MKKRPSRPPGRKSSAQTGKQPGSRRPAKPRAAAPRPENAPATEDSDWQPRPPLPTLPVLASGETLTVSAEVAGHTLLAVLRAVRPGESWSKLKSQVHRGQVTLNRVVCTDDARRLAVGDALAISTKPVMTVSKPDDLKIEYVDAHVVVVVKPAGMMTHRRPEERNWSAERKGHQPTLDEALNQLLAREATTNSRARSRSGPVRCVHRLDRDTSGVLVFARNAEAEQHLVAQFRKHSVHRIYWAIAHGQPGDGTIVSHLVRDRGDGRRGSVQNSKMGQRAVTHVRFLERLGKYSLVECRLETGRTNQIRIHLAEAGHMICGDTKYDQPLGGEAIRDDSQSPRLALHAAELGFIHPVSGEEMFFQVPLPPDLDRFARRLGGRK